MLSRISDTHDVLTLIVPLIDNPPWTRRIKGKKKNLKKISFEKSFWFQFYFFYFILLSIIDHCIKSIDP